MSEKRSMSAALEAANIVEFIQTGVPTTPTDSRTATEKKSEVRSKPTSIEPKTPKTKPNTSKANHQEKDDTPDFTRTMAKARIQKSIRFRPDLIAKLEKYRRLQEEEGKSQISIQDAQNEALAMWLDSKKIK